MNGPFIYRKYYYYYDLLCLRRTVITIIQLPVSVCVLQLATEICVRVVKRERETEMTAWSVKGFLGFFLL